MPTVGLAREIYIHDSLRMRPNGNGVFTANGARELSAVEFYRLVGRPELARASAARKNERALLYTFSFLALGAGVASGVYVTSTAVNPNSAACYTNGYQTYNQCIQSASNTRLLGAALIAGGLVVGGLLFTWAALTPDMVTSQDQTAQLVDQYNRNLSKRLNNAQEPRVEVTPTFGKDGGGLAARFTF